MATGAGLVGTTILQYHVLERLGGGGMGEVYLAEDTRLGRRVALKFLVSRIDTDPEARARLLREAQAAAILRSPHIAVTYDLVEHEDATFIAMEYVDGELLSTRIARGPLAVPDTLDIALQLADALDEAHAHGIVHRDIKSANLILTPRQLLKVLDFGLAKFLRAPTPGELRTMADMTLSGAVLGTLNYMAPEQLAGHVIDHRVDLFAAGIVLYEMLAARLPFTGSAPGEIADRILNHEPDAIARYNYDVPADVEAVIRKALQKEPDFRYQSARELYIDVYNARRRLSGDDSSRGSTAWRGPIDVPSAAAAQAPTRPASGQEPTYAAPAGHGVAVLTFTNITANPSDDWVGQGIAESLTTDLTHVRAVTVVPRDQIFDLQRNLTSMGRHIDERQVVELGRRLGARIVVSGGYQRLGERIRVTAQAMEVAHSRLVSTVKLDGGIGDLFDIQDRLLAELMSHGLDEELHTRDLGSVEDAGTKSPGAFEAYSRGMLNLRLAGRESIDRAIALLEEAVARDPEYVEALVSLAGALQVKGAFLARPDLLEQSLKLLQQALERQPHYAEAKVRLGSTLLELGRPEEAITALREGLALQPHRAAAHSNLARAYWLGLGRIDEAIEEFQHTVRLNPSGGYAHLQLALLHTLRGDFDVAERVAKTAITLQEQAMSGTTGLLIVGGHTRLGYVYYRKGRFDDAIREYRRELEYLAVGDHVLKARTSIELQQKLGAAYRRLGNAEQAERHEQLAIDSFEARLAIGEDEPFTRYYMATLHAVRGDAATAGRHLERPLRELGAFTRWRLKRDPDFDAVRSELGDV